MGRPKLSEIVKLKTRVKKRYPGAITCIDPIGYYFISWNDQNLNDTFLLENTSTEIEAWRQAAVTAKHEQHINRTHPLKKMMSEEKKQQNKERITKRIKKL